MIQVQTALLLLLASPFGGAFTPTLHHSISPPTAPSNQRIKTRRYGTSVDTETITVGEEIGTGSYGTVHYCELEGKQWIGKRPLTKEEIAESLPNDVSAKDIQSKVDRCQYYWNVEEHCYSKLGDHPQLPHFKGTFQDQDNLQWMVFEIVPCKISRDIDNKPACSLTDLMALDHEKQHANTHPHHLYYLQQALGLGDSQDVSLGQTLDVFFQSLLTVLKDIHAKKIVHRDLKPGNLLVSDSVYLIDFGSAADLEPNSQKKKIGFFPRKYVGLEDDTVVAISPVYAAPETFVDRLNKPENFDVFSAGLIYCQLLFNLLDERTDAGFHQQLQGCDWDLDLWLQQELASKVRPRGLEEALAVLSERPGMWRLLKEMFRVKPWDRISSEEALSNFRAILKNDDPVTRGKEDGAYFQSVLESFEMCEVPYEEEQVPTIVSRPLHFVATFKRKAPLGLVLAEINADEEEEEEMSEEARQQWKAATEDALPGQVFVKGVVPGSQAEEFGIFEIGDQLQGVGELPVAERGFEKVVDLLGKQPPSAKYVTLHFDRKKKSTTVPATPTDSAASPVVPADSGAWSAKGRRSSQEDRFVLHEIQDTTGRSVLVAGVFDGHGGTAASKLAADELPRLVSEQLFRTKNIAVEEVLEQAWDTISEDYRQACVEGPCIADYDSKEGKLDANTGAEDLVAGTTAAIAALDESNGRISVLNCGDSRTLLVGSDGIIFESEDHTPEREMPRLKAGKDQGLDYSIPQCSTSRWWLRVGDYQYAVARSLEGPFATSKGIVSMPDVTSLQAEPGMAIVCASDGLWEVMDSGEVAKVIATLRSRGTSAGDAAKTLCSMAIEKGSSDNVSAVIVYLG